MAFITREDGIRFVVPSYRDVITGKAGGALKKEIKALSASYGEYITLQMTSPAQCEVAFSTETGYLLGESVWSYFNRPIDMVYCEAIPDTNEAILVIVKNGSVYLDGSFLLENIADELVIFLTQENSFKIFVYGDVPISETPEIGKFHFEDGSVTEYTVLDKPAFATIPLIKAYQLQLVEQVLAARGIGVFPIKLLTMGLIALAMVWGVWSMLSGPAEVQVVEAPKETPDPFQGYYDALHSPAPDLEIKQLLATFPVLFALPGWDVKSIDYANGAMTAMVTSHGSNIQTLTDWASTQDVNVSVGTAGISLAKTIEIDKRAIPKKIFSITEVTVNLVDKVALVYPGNHLSIGELTSSGPYSTRKIDINISNLSPAAIGLIGDTCANLPVVLNKISLTVNGDGLMSGTISLNVLGS